MQAGVVGLVVDLDCSVGQLAQGQDSLVVSCLGYRLSRSPAAGGRLLAKVKSPKRGRMADHLMKETSKSTWFKEAISFF